MIPREILKKIRPSELRANRIVIDTVSTPSNAKRTFTL
jgi:hypothetical protein